MEAKSQNEETHPSDAFFDLPVTMQASLPMPYVKNF